MDGAGWTIDELAGRVAGVLAGDGYPGAPNGRVRDVPDTRSIRWYATIGLVDRPAAMRGRTALYGERHLLQLVAVKRRQAEGRSIADIQAELAGASDAALRAVAGLPEALAPPSPSAVRNARFWSEAPGAAVKAPAAGNGAVEEAGSGGGDVPGVLSGVLSGVPLPGGAVLLLPAVPDQDDLRAIAAAAAPLLDLLSARGLLRSAP